MGDATLGSPVPLQASIIPLLGSRHKPLYVKKLSLGVCALVLLGSTISSSLSRPPLIPLEAQRNGFSTFYSHRAGPMKPGLSYVRYSPRLPGAVHKIAASVIAIARSFISLHINPTPQDVALGHAA